MTQRREIEIQMKISTCDKSDSSLSKYVSTLVNMSLILNYHSGGKQVATGVWSFEGRQRASLREGVEEIRDQDRWQRQTANDGHRRKDQTNVPRGARNFIPWLPQVEDGIGNTLFFQVFSWLCFSIQGTGDDLTEIWSELFKFIDDDDGQLTAKVTTPRVPSRVLFKKNAQFPTVFNHMFLILDQWEDISHGCMVVISFHFLLQSSESYWPFDFFIAEI